jgi:hypothetical protein
MRAMAAAWASVSEPAARVCSIRMARRPSREAHTPCWLAGLPPVSRVPIISIISPVGSWPRRPLSIMPAGEASRSILASTAVRRPALEKRSGLTAGLSR